MNKPEPNPWYENPSHIAKQHEEKIQMEQKFYKIWQAQDHKKTCGYLGEKYRINDPRKRVYMPDKITDVTPDQPFKKQVLDRSDTKNENAVQRTFMLNALERRIKSGILRPKQKYPHTMTSNQEYGWDGGDGEFFKKNERQHKPIRSTPITNYVENYYLTRGINPFKIRDRVKDD